MTNEDLREVASRPNVMRILAQKLSNSEGGFQNVAITDGDHARQYRVVRLDRFGNKLKLSKAKPAVR